MRFNKFYTAWAREQTLTNIYIPNEMFPVPVLSNSWKATMNRASGAHRTDSKARNSWKEINLFGQEESHKITIDQAKYKVRLCIPQKIKDCSHSPIFSGVSHSSYQLHSFGVILRLCMQTKVTLYKVPWGHVMLAILHNTGILQRKYKQSCEWVYTF